MQGARLSATDIACRRGDRLLFSGLGFELSPGDALHVTGPNGVGKSSLLRIVAGLLRPFAGRVEREGAIGLLDEHPALDEHRTLENALAFWARLDDHPAIEQRALDLLGLHALLDVPVRYLSTGQRKRAAIARLMAQTAPIWLLDEPLNGLDRHAAKLAQELVEDHCASGGIALIASHQALELTDLELRTLPLTDFAA